MRPKAFHAITSAPADAGEPFVRELLARDTRMVPADLREVTATKFTGIRDRMGGDGAYVFFSLVRPLHGYVTFGKPTFAFDVQKLCERYHVALRIKDLQGEYLQVSENSRVEKLLRAWQEDELEDVTQVPRRSSDFTLVANAATQRDPLKARMCVQTLAFADRPWNPAYAPEPPTEAEVLAVVETCARPKKLDEYVENLRAVLYRLRALWERGPGEEAELLVQGRVPLREAVAWSLDCEDWRPL